MDLNKNKELLIMALSFGYGHGCSDTESGSQVSVDDAGEELWEQFLAETDNQSEDIK